MHGTVRLLRLGTGLETTAGSTALERTLLLVLRADSLAAVAAHGVPAVGVRVGGERAVGWRDEQRGSRPRATGGAEAERASGRGAAAGHAAEEGRAATVDARELRCRVAVALI